LSGMAAGVAVTQDVLLGGQDVGKRAGDND
jgi:hypothetical protein